MSENPNQREPSESEGYFDQSSQGSNPFTSGNPEPRPDSPNPQNPMERLLPQDKEIVTGFVAGFYAQSSWMELSSHSFQAHFGPEPTPEVIALASKTIETEISDRKHSRLFWFATLFLLVGAALAVLMTLAITGENSLFLEVVKLLAVGVGGFGGGYGLSAWRSRN